MKIATLLLKVPDKSVCHCASMDSILFLCGLLLKSWMEQLLVGSAKHAQVTNTVLLVLIIFVHVLHKHQFNVCIYTHSFTLFSNAVRLQILKTTPVQCATMSPFVKQLSLMLKHLPVVQYLLPFSLTSQMMTFLKVWNTFRHALWRHLTGSE